MIEKLTHFYRSLTKESLSDLPLIYSNNVSFVDPIGKHEGLPTLSNYFQALLENTTLCTFEIQEANQVKNSIYLVWEMHYAHPKLAKGKTLMLEGMSRLTVEQDKVVFQQDYYDLGAMLYEHIPLLGSLLRTIKKRI